MIQPEYITLLVISIISVFLTFHSTKLAIPQSVFGVAEFGATPWCIENAISRLKKVISACTKAGVPVLSIQKRRYDLWPERAERRECCISTTPSETKYRSKIKTSGSLFESMKNLSCKGSGSRPIIHGKMITTLFRQSENIKLPNVRADFGWPRMSEMVCLEWSYCLVLVRIDTDRWYATADQWLVGFRDGGA